LDPRNGKDMQECGLDVLAKKQEKGKYKENIGTSVWNTRITQELEHRKSDLRPAWEHSYFRKTAPLHQLHVFSAPLHQL